MALSKTEAQTIRNVIRRLRGEQSAPEVRKALTETCGIYLESWVIPALQILVEEPDGEYYDRRTRMQLAESISRIGA